MWHTPKGNRKLEGAEARLIREAIGCFADEIEMEVDCGEPYTVGVRLFDRLEWQQKIVLLAEVGTALLGDCPPPKLTAVNEATVAAIYEYVHICLQIEIDNEGLVINDLDTRFWRTLVLAAITELDAGPPSPDPNDELPTENSNNIEEWSSFVGTLEDCVLHDDDWDMDDLFMDASPELSAARKDFLSIDPDYFTAIPPDPSEAEVDNARATIRALARE